MARVDYWSIQNELVEILKQNLNDVTITLEEDFMLSSEMTPWLCVYLEGREVPESQPIAAGRRVRMRVRLSIWIWCYALELHAAVQARDDLVGRVELILAENRSLNDKVDALWIEGGQLPSVNTPEAHGFFSGGEIVVSSEITAEVA